jgi:hypothetical protein
MVLEVKVTIVPAQIGFADAAMVMLTGSTGFTVITTLFDDAGFPEVQVSLEVTVQAIAFPFAGTKE